MIKYKTSYHVAKNVRLLNENISTEIQNTLMFGVEMISWHNDLHSTDCL